MPEPQQVHEDRVDYEGLKELAHRLLQESDLTQKEMADRLDVTRSSVGRAVTTQGSLVQRLQRRIIEELSDYTVGEPNMIFPLQKKEEKA
jgi:predicted DNA-binding protein (UPF0251 family)